MKYFVLMVAVIVGISCSTHGSNGSTKMDDPVAKVGVYQDGRIILNGRNANIDEVRAAFAKLVERHGVVWYYREAAASEPHPNAMLVIQAVVTDKLPISMSTQPDFSDVMLPDGTTRLL
jgi:hypothetical protein